MLVPIPITLNRFGPSGTGQGLIAMISRFENRMKVFCILSDARAFQANARAARVQDRTLETLIDVLA